MAITVGNIAANPDYDSPISVIDADTYHAKRGNAAWAALDVVKKEQLLVNATDYLRAIYSRSWSLATLAATTVPKLMGEAAAELALAGKDGPLIPNATRGKKKVKVGPLEVEYDDANPGKNRFIFASLKIAPLLFSATRSAAMVPLVRC